MKIGSLTLQVGRPKDLDEQLRASTGCSAAEIREHLRGPVIAGAVAAALLPFVKGEKPVRHTLAEEIAKAGTDKVRSRVLALYEKSPPAAAEPPAGTADGEGGDGQAQG